MTAVGYAAPRNPRGQQKKGFDPVCFRWDDSAAVTATALAAYAAEHADALKKPRLPARIQRFLDEPPPRSETEAEDFPEVTDGKGSKLFPMGPSTRASSRTGCATGTGGTARRWAPSTRASGRRASAPERGWSATRSAMCTRGSLRLTSARA